MPQLPILVSKWAEKNPMLCRSRIQIGALGLVDCGADPDEVRETSTDLLCMRSGSSRARSHPATTAPDEWLIMVKHKVNMGFRQAAWQLMDVG